MKPRLCALLIPMAAALILTISARVILLGHQVPRPSPAAADSANPGQTMTNGTDALSGQGWTAPSGEEPAARQARWLTMAATPEGLARLDSEIRELPAAPLPGLCQELLSSPEPEPEPGRTPLLRLLAMRWAELDGEAALEWAHAHFRQGKPGDWDPWLTDLFSAWSMTQPDAASAWLSRVLASDDSKESWSPYGRAIPFEKWARPGNVLALARAQLSAMKPRTTVFQFTPTAPTFSRQITTMDEVRALRTMVEAAGTKWPEKIPDADGVLTTRNSGAPQLEIAAAFEWAWARLDPASWRAYAEERVIGAAQTNLPLALAVEDCRQADDPAAVAREFLAKPSALLADANEIRRLLDTVDERRPGAAWSLVQDGGLPAAMALPMKAAIAARFAQNRHTGDPNAALAELEEIQDPALRDKAVETSLMIIANESGAEAGGSGSTTTNGSIATGNAGGGNPFTEAMRAAGWTEDRIAAFQELRLSAPIYNSR